MPKDIPLKNSTPPTDNITLDILGNTYVVKFPNTGEYVDIESRKVSYVDNYKGLFGSTMDANIARLMIDMVATFTILLPEMVNKLNAKSFFDLEFKLMYQLVNDVYVKQYLPWYTSHMNFYAQSVENK